MLQATGERLDILSIALNIVIAAGVVFCLITLGVVLLAVAETYLDEGFRIGSRQRLVEALEAYGPLEMGSLWDYQKSRIQRIRYAHVEALERRGAPLDPADVTVYIVQLLPNEGFFAPITRLIQKRDASSESVRSQRVVLQAAAESRLEGVVREPNVTLAALSSRAERQLQREEWALRFAAIKDFGPSAVFAAAWFVAGYVSAVTVVVLIPAAAWGLLSTAGPGGGPPVYRLSGAVNVGLFIGVVSGSAALLARLFSLAPESAERPTPRQRGLLLLAAVAALLLLGSQFATNWQEWWFKKSTEWAEEAVDGVFASSIGLRVAFGVLAIGCSYGTYRTLKSLYRSARAGSLGALERAVQVQESAVALFLLLPFGVLSWYAVLNPSLIDQGGRPQQAPNWMILLNAFAMLGPLVLALAASLVAAIARASRRHQRMKAYRAAGIDVRYLWHPALVVASAGLFLGLAGLALWEFVPLARAESAADVGRAPAWQFAAVFLFFLALLASFIAAPVLAVVQVRRRRTQDQRLAAQAERP